MLRRIFIIAYCLAPFSIMAQGTIKISPGATLKLTDGVVVTLDNMHLENNGTLTLGAGDGIFRFTGNATTNILGSSLPLFDAMEIAKTGGADLQLQRNISVVSAINFISGLFDLNNNNILLQSTALLNGESESSRITGLNGGFVEITKNLNAPVSENPGNMGAVVNSAQNLGSTLIRRGHVAQNVGGQIAINRYFDITPVNNSGLNANLRFQYFDAEMNGNDENSVVLWKSPDNTTWSEIGFDSRNTAGNYVEKTGIAGFSRWTLQQPSGALPVIFTFINARCENGKIIITWKTAQEINSSRFDIERSVNGRDWTVLGTVQSSGNSSIEKSYVFVDANPFSSSGMYRIAEYDLNGRVMYTTVIYSSCGDNDNINVWPNPVQDMAWLNINMAAPSAAIVKLYDARGSLILSRKTALLPGSNQVVVPMQMLSQGIYELRVEYGMGKVRTFKLVKH